MLTAMILICSLANAPNVGDCNRDNARDVVWVPETFNSPVTCLMHGQAYIAGTSIGRNLTADERIRVLCARKVAAAVPEETVADRRAPPR